MVVGVRSPSSNLMCAIQHERCARFYAGGDDYIPKPFSMEELLLKIRIFLKRSQSQPINPLDVSSKIPIGNFDFHPDDLSLTINGETRSLTLKEAELIRFFAANTNKILS